MDRGYFFGGAAPGPPMWGSHAAPQLNPSSSRMSPERVERLNHLQPILQFLKEGRIPSNISSDSLNSLMNELKEEGNCCFKDRDFNSAYEMYTASLNVCKNLQTSHFIIPEKKFLSTVFSNRAACLLKMDFFKESIDDCDIALQQDPENLKAHYRQSTAKKSLRDYVGALKAATIGREQAIKINKVKDVKEFDELICEIKSHLPPEKVTSTVGNSLSSGISQLSVNAKTSIRETTKSNISADVNSKIGWKQMPPKRAEVKVDEEKKQAMSRASTTTAKKEIDPSWLVGTNADIKKKPAPSKPSKSQKTGSASGSNKKEETNLYHGRFEMLAKEEEESSDEAEELYSDDEDDETDESEEAEVEAIPVPSKSIKTADRKPDMGLDDFSSPSTLRGQVQTTTNPKPAKSETRYTPSQASQAPSFPSNPPQQHVQQKLVSTNNNVVPAPTSFPGFKANQPPQAPVQMMQHAPMQLKGAPFKEPSQQGIDYTALQGEFVPFETMLPIPPVFRVVFDFVLVCNNCYPQTKHGHSGYRSLSRYHHNCEHNVLLVRHRGDGSARWAKIRPRFALGPYIAKYFLCRDYISERPCRQTEPYCTFAHYEEEIQLWILDRNQQINIGEFVLAMRANLDTGQVRNPNKEMMQLIKTFFNPTINAPANIPKQVGHPVSEVQHRQPGVKSLMEVKVKPEVQNLMQPKVPQVLKSGALTTGDDHTPSNNNHGPVRSMNSDAHTSQPSRPATWSRVAASPPRRTVHDQYLNQEQHAAQGPSRIAFPLWQMCDFHVVCNQCLLPLPSLPGIYFWNSGIKHGCLEDVLAVQRKGGDNVWVKIRERLNHRSFPGNYILCKHFKVHRLQDCTHKDNCSFAHSDEEMRLWTLEKDGKFNIMEFIRQNKTPTSASQFTVEAFLVKYPGHLGYICSACYHYEHLISGQNLHNIAFCTKGTHEWKTNKRMIHLSNDGNQITLIGHRPFMSKEAYFDLCRHKQFCARLASGMCKYAHSFLERDIWCLERDLDLTQENIVEEGMKLFQRQQAARQHAVAPPAVLPPVNRPPPLIEAAPSAGRPQQPNPAVGQPQAPAILDGSSRTSSISSSEQTNVPAIKCPHRVVAACGLCWQKGTISQQSKDRCSASAHNWQMNKIYLALPARKKISPLPKHIPQNLTFAICRLIQQKKKCDYTACQFAHSTEEIAIWTWMAKNKVKTLDDLVEICQKTHDASTAAKSIGRGQSVVAVRPVNAPQPAPYASPLDLVQNAHYCHYCSVHCNSQKQWDEHCASEKHMFNVNSDKEHQWNYRQPPWGIGGSGYELCSRHIENANCRYSDMPDMYNQCKFAHSREELDEWKERWEWRQLKREIAKKEHLYSYMEQLREDFETTESGINVISESVDGIQVKCTSSLHVYDQKKNTTYSWIFELNTGDQILHRVALLNDPDRLHFAIRGSDLDKFCQIAQGETFLQVGRGNGNCYRVEVVFNGGIFGSFTQWVIFDFDKRPVLVRKINVELGTQFVQEKVKILREKLKFDRWTSDNRQVVWFDEIRHQERNFNSELLQFYKAPSSADTVITQQTVGIGLNRHNYVHKMHKLLLIEELTQARILSRYNITTEMELLDKIIDDKGLVGARLGELFARINLTDQLNEDSDAGHLILSGVSTVLIAPLDRSDEFIYEADFVLKDNFDYNGKGRDHIYLCLSQRCCKELQLMSGQRREVEIQFQLNRLTFCQMHYAVDQLENTDIVFPDISKVNQTWNERHIFQLSSQVLNEDQMRVVEYIAAERQGYTPPLIIYGPFGTGKTETLAQAAMVLSFQASGTRILICTHSNSAADVYISRHLDAFITTACKDLKVLRIYAKERRTNTVSATVKKYCCMSKDHSCFIEPTRDEILSHHIIITTLVTSLTLTTKELNLRGTFSHIFIDEAAQAHECEAIMPLSLASESTSVVLAGDHHQMSQKVYSHEAKRQKFHRSLVERLFEHYKTYGTITDSSLPNILLKINYRTKMELLRFVAAVIYGGPDALVSRSDQPNVIGIVPLAFHTALGREKQDADSTSYYNLAEIEEVVERVSDLCFNWPIEWEAVNAESILVVTPYTDQVIKIRDALKRKNKILGRVTVDRVSNVQGTEFRVVFISTVRTRHLAEEPPRMQTTARDCDGDFGDFGFLSDQKLLNTAFTRARSMVAVIGDPAALCAIGECTNIWRTYLKHCQNLKSISPSTVTLDTVKSQVQTLLNSPICGPNLQLLAALHQEAASGVYRMQPVPEGGTGDETSFAGMKPEPNPFESITLKGVFEDWSLDYQIEPDVIIQQLAAEFIKNGDNGDFSRNGKAATNTKPDGYRIQEKDGHAIIELNKSVVGEGKRRLPSADSQRGYNSDEDASSDESTESPSAYVDYHPQHLKEFLKRQPDRYTHCTLNTENSRSMFAKVLSGPLHGKHITIANRLRCGRAFNGDEVVVELLPIDHEDTAAVSGKQQQDLHGQVIGIIKRAIDPKYRMFICMIEQDNTGLMVPINRDIPKIFNLETASLSEKAKKGHVCVYTFTKDREIIFHHHEPVDPSNPAGKLFIVRYLKWEAKFHAPIGIVLGVLPPGTTIDHAMKILNIEYYIPKKFKKDTLEEVEKLYPSSYSIPLNEISSRFDCRDMTVFTVDVPDSKELDSAISIQSLEDNCFLVGVHVADVSYFVKQGSCIDGEAGIRGCLLRPVDRDSIPMLPERLSQDLCSLLPGKDRLAISIFMWMDSTADIQSVQLKHTVVRSKFRMDYAELDRIIREKRTETDLDMNILMLSRIAQIWRRNRLGNAALYHPLSLSAAYAPEAHLVMEELMITANHQVALHLTERFSEVTPLRIQSPPNDSELAEWRERYTEEARNTVALTRPFKRKGEVCVCSESCTCIPPSRYEDLTFDIQKSVWDLIWKAFMEGDMELAQSLVINPENHPQVSLALLALSEISNPSQYVCSGDVPLEERYHYSLNISFYTHFTSPIRRFLDLVVHRLLAAYINGKSSTYNQADMTEICTNCTAATVRSQSYERATELLHYAKLFQEHPASLFPVLEDNLDLDVEIQLRFPLLPALVPSRTRIAMSWLHIVYMPLWEGEEIAFEWSRRIYDLKPTKTAVSKRSDDDDDFHRLELNGKKYTLQTVASDWQELVQSIVNNDNVLDNINNISQLLLDSNEDDLYEVDVTSEGENVRSGKHYCSFYLTILNAALVKVQVIGEFLNGLLAPSIQLLNLTPTLDLCLEHQRNPVRCFSGTTMNLASKQTYRDVSAYQSAWLPVLAMESACRAVQNDDSIVIHHVGIAWQEQEASAGKTLIGSFKLPVDFCKERLIRFGINPSLAEEDRIDDLEQPDVDGCDGRVCIGYLCIRYNSVSTEAPKTTLAVDQLIDPSSPITWVGHGMLTKVVLGQDRSHYTISLKLHQNSVQFPQEIIRQQAEQTATVEIIFKTLPDRHVEVVLDKLESAHQLAKDIALGRSPLPLAEDYTVIVEKWRNYSIPGMVPCNLAQSEAVVRALRQPFTVIQGPPGTGKTVLAARLAFLFSRVNLDQAALSGNDRIYPQVMCCGPSEQSVDVIARQLLQLKCADLKIVRVYSETIERIEFPLPKGIALTNMKLSHEPYKYDGEDLKSIALHHMIRRQAGDDNSFYVNEMDERIRNRNPLSSQEVREYITRLEYIEMTILASAHVVLCTCAVSSTLKMKRATRVQQLIIDECGSCTEPEGLVPIASSEAKQVVLIGDHQQLQPVILDSMARKRGLEVSLLERYSEKAIVLTTQYRMHESIAEFPSKQFYSDRLVIGKDDQSKASSLKFWPNGKNKPFAFLHVMGWEHSETVPTADGEEDSRINEKEVEVAVRTASMLVRRFHVKPVDVAVLTQYEAQRTHIESALRWKGENEVTVSTVTAAQGNEWDYVILSTVRSLPKAGIEKRPTVGWRHRNLGFITDAHQINVALTRARKGLIIIGNKHLLSCDPTWRRLLRHYESHKKVVAASDFMP